MQISEILTPERTRCCAPGGSKKRLLEFLANFLAEQSDFADPTILYEQLLARERLGSTGIGDGVAIPHCRLPGFDQSIGVLLKLEQQIDFDAIDDQPVDVIFALVVPEDVDSQQHSDDHLHTLSNIAAMLQDPEQRNQLRAAGSDQRLFEIAIAA